MLEQEAKCPECEGLMNISATWVVHDRFDIELEVDATCTCCVFTYDGRIEAEKMGALSDSSISRRTRRKRRR